MRETERAVAYGVVQVRLRWHRFLIYLFLECPLSGDLLSWAEEGATLRYSSIPYSLCWPTLSGDQVPSDAEVAIHRYSNLHGPRYRFFLSDALTFCDEELESLRH